MMNNSFKSGMSDMAREANFGTRLWSSFMYLASKYLHLIIAVFIALIIWFSLAPHYSFEYTVAPIGLYLLYFLGKKVFIRIYSKKAFYNLWVQIFRAQIAMIGLFFLLWATRNTGSQFGLWVLFVSPLLIISRHCPSKIFLLTVFEACGMIVLARWDTGTTSMLSSTTQSGIPVGIADLIVHCLSLVFVSFLLHYLMRNIDARNNIIESYETVEALSTHSNHDKLPEHRWQHALDAYLKIVKGSCGSVWRYEHGTQNIRPLTNFLYCVGQTCAVNVQDYQLKSISLAAGDPIAHTVRTGQPIYCVSNTDAHHVGISTAQGIIHGSLPVGIYSRIIIPILNGGNSTRSVAGAICIDFESNHAPRESLLPEYYEFLSGLARKVVPILYYVQRDEESHILNEIGLKVSSTLKLKQILDEAVEAIVETLGFEFAAISQVDQERQVVRTVAGRNIPSEWIDSAIHPLSSNDIQADIVRKGRQEVLKDWDSRFDRTIWEKFNHDKMVRVFTPIKSNGHTDPDCVLGTIEAGYRTSEAERISDDQKRMLTTMAQQLFVAIENAELFESTQRRAEYLAQLHKIGWEVALSRNLLETLTLVGNTLQKLLEADIIMLYRYNQQTQFLEHPKIFGEILGLDKYELRLPSSTKGIVATILSSRKPHYIADVSMEPMLRETNASPGNRSFTDRQNIVSFAGVPMIVNNQVVGVLCLNYRTRHAFLDDEQQILEIAAQFAATAIYNAETSQLAEEAIISGERERLSMELHDALSQYLPAIEMMTGTALAYLTSAPQKLEEQLQKIKSATMRAVYEMRINIFELHNQDWSPHNLFEILENSASEARSFFGFDVKLNVKYDETVRQAQLPVPIIRELLMVCRECIANTAKHAGATVLEMHISITPRVVTLSMQDNGHGFDPTRMNHRGNRGLSMLKQRVSRLNGELKITSQIGSGTTVQVEIPIT